MNENHFRMYFIRFQSRATAQMKLSFLYKLQHKLARQTVFDGCPSLLWLSWDFRGSSANRAAANDYCPLLINLLNWINKWMSEKWSVRKMGKIPSTIFQGPCWHLQMSRFFLTNSPNSKYIVYYYIWQRKVAYRNVWEAGSNISSISSLIVCIVSYTSNITLL